MLKEAKEIIKFIEENKDADYLLPLMLEKKLQVILKQERYNGAIVRAIDDTRLSVVHPSAYTEVKRTAGNSIEITLVPYKK